MHVHTNKFAIKITIESLNITLTEEKQEQSFGKLPLHYIEISNLLLQQYTLSNIVHLMIYKTVVKYAQYYQI